MRDAPRPGAWWAVAPVRCLAASAPSAAR
jgi:hypothetical protein